MIVLALDEDNEGTDITEGVKTLYDMVICSMDWGSGFLSIEDATEVIRVAQACGFLMPEGAAEQFERYARKYGDSASSDVRCAVCRGQVRYSYGYAQSSRPDDRWVYPTPTYKRDTFHWDFPRGWHHVDLVAAAENPHDVKLWADAA